MTVAQHFADCRRRKRTIQQQYRHRKRCPPKPIPVHSIGGTQKPVFSTLGNARNASALVLKCLNFFSVSPFSGQESAGSTDFTSSTSSSIAQPYPSTGSTDGGKFFRQTSGDARFSHSTVSLEAITRRGSNPDTPGGGSGANNHQPSSEMTQTTGTTKHESISSINRAPIHGSSGQHPTPQQVVERSKQTCACSCVGWAEIYIRRPTGNMSWIMRNQNQISFDTASPEFPLNDLVNLFVPTLGGVFNNDFHSDNPSPMSACSPEVPEHARKTSASSQMSDTRSQDDEYGSRRLDFDDAAPLSSMMMMTGNRQTPSSGPIAIPKSSQPTKESAGSFSDVEPELDEENPDIEYEDDESRSRNPVRRVNSSPEMSSNWRNPLLNPKGTGIVGLNTGGSGAGISQVSISSGSANPPDDDKTIEVEQQQKKKVFCKDMRVSCEAIPEEIPGSTPPSHPNSVKEATALLVGKTSQHIGGVVSESIEVTAKQACLVPSASFPTETKSESETLSPQGAIVPKKQLSADDATQSSKGDGPQPLQLQLQPSSVSKQTGLKLPMDMPKVTTKPPQSPAPLSPRLLAKNAANKISSFAPSVAGGGGGGGGGMGGSSGVGGGGNSNNGNGNSSNGDVIRGRSKTISVVREHDNRDNLKWTTFKGSMFAL